MLRILLLVIGVSFFINAESNSSDAVSDEVEARLETDLLKINNDISEFNDNISQHVDDYEKLTKLIKLSIEEINTSWIQLRSA
ncbi:MAG: hypothetical protein V7749_16565 [Cocleimonas sp.]